LKADARFREKYQFGRIWLFGQTDFVFAGGGWAFGGEAAEGRVAGGGDFDEVETETVCEGESFRDGQNAELFLFVADDLDFVGTNALVFPGRLIHRKQAKLRVEAFRGDIRRIGW
jgi:hypothetical protein